MLYEKGVPRDMWQEALQELPNPEEGIRSFLDKRFRGKKPQEAERKRATNALLRRGHSWRDIRRVMEEYGSWEEESECYEYADSDF